MLFPVFATAEAVSFSWSLWAARIRAFHSGLPTFFERGEFKVLRAEFIDNFFLLADLSQHAVDLGGFCSREGRDFDSEGGLQNVVKVAFCSSCRSFFCAVTSLASACLRPLFSYLASSALICRGETQRNVNFSVCRPMRKRTEEPRHG